MGNLKISFLPHYMAGEFAQKCCCGALEVCRVWMGLALKELGWSFGEENWTGILFSTWIVPDPDAEEVPRPPVCCRCSLRWFVNP